jgi:hypothetical protein
MESVFALAKLYQLRINKKDFMIMGQDNIAPDDHISLKWIYIVLPMT